MAANNNRRGPLLGWKGASTDRSMASVRFRVEAPVEGLKALGHRAEVFDPASADAYDLLVFAKAYTKADQALARAVARRGGRTVLDLCDNHFYNPADLPKYRQARQSILAMIDVVDRVTCSTPALAEVIAAETGVTAHVVGDVAEQPAVERGPGHPGEPLRLLWFGSHGSPNAPSGMTDLGLIADDLRALSRATPLILTVCSNARAKYEAEIAPLGFPSAYVEWSEAEYLRLLGEADAVVLPIEINPFTACKTHNRLTSALWAGIPTLATGLESYREFAACCRLDDWRAGFEALVADYAGEQARALSARGLIQDRWSREVVARRWAEVLELKSDDGFRSATVVSEGMVFQGHLDAVADRAVTGWVRDPSRPGQKLEVVLERDGVVVAIGVADLPRDDLAAAGMPGSDCGFSLPLGGAPLDAFQVRVAGDGWLVGENARGAGLGRLDRSAPPLAEAPDHSVIEASAAHQAAMSESVREVNGSLGEIRRLLAQAVFASGVTARSSRPVADMAAEPEAPRRAKGTTA